VIHISPRSALLFAAVAGCLSIPSFATAKNLTVAADGSGDFKTVQAAIDAVPANGKSQVTVTIKPGIYKERVKIGKDKPFIKLSGEDPLKTVLTWNWNASSIGDGGKPVGTFGSPTVIVEANDFLAENITIENAAGDTGQAVALTSSGDRQIYRNCRVTGWQDTIFAANGRQYFAGCYIDGRVDFIFGGATAVFDKCEIHSKNGGFVTAASTAPTEPFGYVFLNCKLTGSAEPFDPATTNPSTDRKPGRPGSTALLGRPWRPNASVMFIHCDIGSHISPEGWSDWGQAANQQSTRFVEYGNTGPGADMSKRVPWAKQLSKEHADKITPQSVLVGKDNWKLPAEAVNYPAVGYIPPVAAPNGSVITLAAKDVTIRGDHARLEAGQSIGWWSDTDTTFEWKADLQPGRYRVSLSYAFDGSQGGGDLEVTVGQQTFKKTPAATDSWDDVRSSVLGEVRIGQSAPVLVTLRAVSKKGQYIMNVSDITLSKLSN